MSHFTNDPDPLGHTEHDTSIDIPQGTAGFLFAAHTWASDILKARGGVPGVMILGRGEGDEREMLQVFPSDNDEEAYVATMVEQARDFGADFAIWATEGTLTLTRGSEDVAERCALFYSRGPGEPIRALYAVIVGDILGPMNSMLGTHEQRFLDLVFPNKVH